VKVLQRQEKMLFSCCVVDKNVIKIQLLTKLLDNNLQTDNLEESMMVDDSILIL